jgi:hypothetical protein
VFDGSSALMLGRDRHGCRSGEHGGHHVRIAAQADTMFDQQAEAATSRDHMTSMHRLRRPITDARRACAGGRRSRPTPTPSCLTEHRLHRASIARFRLEARILAFSPDERTVRQLSISWGARAYPIEALPIEAMISRALELARTRGEVRSGDLVAVLAGSPEHHGKATDTLRLMRVPSNAVDRRLRRMPDLDAFIAGLAVYRPTPIARREPWPAGGPAADRWIAASFLGDLSVADGDRPLRSAGLLLPGRRGRAGRSTSRSTTSSR